MVKTRRNDYGVMDNAAVHNQTGKPQLIFIS